MAYLTWDTKTISDFSEKNINTLYDQGYVFGRVSHGTIHQTRSLRIDLQKFSLSSENRRVLRKTENVTLNVASLPYQEYSWEIGKLAKDFYDTKFGTGTFSANKVKELLTDKDKSNFNKLFTYSLETNKVVGYCIILETSEILHYCYPFYTLEDELPANLGLGMMLKAIVWAQEHDKKYVYLGSFQRPTDSYKLQFEGIEWFDGSVWQTGIDSLKKVYGK